MDSTPFSPVYSTLFQTPSLHKTTVLSNFYFNAALNLGSETDTLYSVVKIIRSQPIEGTDNYLYGCEFVGMAPILGYIFDEYEAKIEAGK